MLRRAQAREGGALLAQADVHRLPFPTGTFDVVICHAVFPHFADKRRALAELRRALWPGGQLLILHDTSRETVNAIHREAGETVRHDLLPPPWELEALLQAVGFTGVQGEEDEDYYLVMGYALPQSEAGSGRTGRYPPRIRRRDAR